MTNPSMPGLVKVGKTHRHPHDRLQELSAATGVPTPFELRHVAYVSNPDKSEKKLHEIWESLGVRTSHGREFFRLDLNKAIDDIEKEKKYTDNANQPTRTEVDDLLQRGFVWMKGDDKTLRDPHQALHYFEQASAKNSGVGSYWAGRLSEKLGKSQPRRLSSWNQRALNHYQHACRKGVLKASARLFFLYAKSKQWPEANHYWSLWLDGLYKKDNIDLESSRWLCQYLEKTPFNRINSNHPVWKKYRKALKKTAKEQHYSEVIKKLNLINTHWKNYLIKIGFALLISIVIVLMIYYKK